MLIHAGASGVGMAAIQLVRLANAIPIVTAGTQEKLQATTNAGAAAGFNYKNEDFSEKVLAFTQGKNLCVKDTVKSMYLLKHMHIHSISTESFHHLFKKKHANPPCSLWC